MRDEASDTTTRSQQTVHWLDPGERETWLRLMALMVRLPGALDTQLQRDAGLTLFEYTVLAVLSEQPTRSIRMSRLAALAQGSLSRLSHVAAKLERHGLLERHPCPDDGRYTDAVLTDAGYARVAESAPAHVRAVRDLVLDPLTEEQLDQLRAIAETVLTRIDPKALPLSFD